MRRLLSGHIHLKASAKSGNPDPGRQISAKGTKPGDKRVKPRPGNPPTIIPGDKGRHTPGRFGFFLSPQRSWGEGTAGRRIGGQG